MWLITMNPPERQWFVLVLFVLYILKTQVFWNVKLLLCEINYFKSQKNNNNQIVVPKNKSQSMAEFGKRMKWISRQFKSLKIAQKKKNNPKFTLLQFIGE